MMSKRFFVVSLIIIGLILNCFSFYAQGEPTNIINDSIIIDSLQVYRDLGFDISKIDNPILYEKECLVEGHMPLVIKFNNPTAFSVNEKSTLISSVESVKNNFGSISYKYKILQSYVYSYIQPIYKTVIVCNNVTDNKTSKIIQECHNESVAIGNKTVLETRYHWIETKDINSLSISKNGFIVIDVIGNFKASLGIKSIDIIPELTINSVKYSFPKYAWWSSSWEYKKQITVTNKRHNYESNITVNNVSGGNVDCEGHANANFSDIRFVSSDNVTVIPYWIENYTSGSTARIWFNNSENNSVIWLYYGNHNAPPVSNGYDTFFYLFEDFNSISEWTNNSGGHFTLSGGIMSMKNVASEATWHYLRYDLGDEYQIRLLARHRPILAGFTAEHDFLISQTAWATWQSDVSPGFGFHYYHTVKSYQLDSWDNSGGNFACYEVVPYVYNTWYRAFMKYYNAGYSYNDVYSLLGSFTGGTGIHAGLRYVYLSTRPKSGQGAQTTEWDFVVVMSYMNTTIFPEPTFTFGSEIVYNPNSPPAISNENPLNNSINNPLFLTWNCTIIDIDGDLFNWSIVCSNGQYNQLNYDSNGSKYLILTGLSYYTNYTVWVNVSNVTNGHYVKKLYHFTTMSRCPVISNISENLSIWYCVYLSDDYGSITKYNISLFNNSQYKSYSGVTVGNTTVCVLFSNLSYNITYIINISVYDGFCYTNSSDTFNISIGSSLNMSEWLYIGVGSMVDVVISMDMTLLFTLLLMVGWIVFTVLFFKNRFTKNSIILGFLQFCFAMPLTFVVGSLSSGFVLGYAIVFIIPMLSLVILTISFFDRK